MLRGQRRSEAHQHRGDDLHRTKNLGIDVASRSQPFHRHEPMQRGAPETANLDRPAETVPPIIPQHLLQRTEPGYGLVE